MAGEVCEWAGELLADAGGVGWVRELEDSDVGITLTTLTSSSFSETGHETWSWNYICIFIKKSFLIIYTSNIHIFLSVRELQSSKRTRFEWKTIYKLYVVMSFMRTSHIPHIFVNIISVDEAENDTFVR